MIDTCREEFGASFGHPMSSQNKKYSKQGGTMDSNVVTIEQEVLRWLGVTSAPGRFGAVAFRYGKREIGHIHRDRIADLPVTLEMREELLSKGRARPHRAGVKGYISYPVQDPEDVSAVIQILGWNYDRAKAAADRRAASREPEDVEHGSYQEG
jgi:hypothetical protein